MDRCCKAYLVFMIIACAGALAWQLLAPQFAAHSAWGVALGWQREIAFWNVALVTALLWGVRAGSREVLFVLTLQCAVLCLVLGANHLAALIEVSSSMPWLHVLGTVEVLVVGGFWGVWALREMARRA